VLGSLSSTPPHLSSVTQRSASLPGTSVLRSSFGQRGCGFQWFGPPHPENFLDMPLEVNPITVLVNDTNPRALLTRLCQTMAAESLHGVVFEDDVDSEAVAQILDFISSQTSIPIIGISGG
ncbi:hypothetical protein M9458_024721, partial [Cirrhinus mrigala]